MARKTKEEANNTRKRILCSALDLFVKKGYAHTTFNDIASRLGFTKGAVYWHFKSKADLLAAILNEALDYFKTKLSIYLEGREPSFKVIAQKMIEDAVLIVSNKRRRDFFMLVNRKIEWTDKTLAEIVAKLKKERSDGPYHTFINAVENDKKNGLVSETVNACEVASASMAIWEGLILRHIEGFLECDLKETLTKAFDVIWQGIKKEKI